jgi:nucleoside-diphosphate-sugar epimerase
MTQNMQQQPLVLVLGGTGKVGRRIAARLTARGVPVRIGARPYLPSRVTGSAYSTEPAASRARTWTGQPGSPS